MSRARDKVYGGGGGGAYVFRPVVLDCANFPNKSGMLLTKFKNRRSFHNANFDKNDVLFCTVNRGELIWDVKLI